MIQPLSFQQVNWDAYIRDTMDGIGVSPTRSLDKAGVKLDKPHAYFASLTDSYNGDAMRHCFFSFIGKTSLNILADYVHTNLDVMHTECPEERGTYVYIISGNLAQWKDAVIQMCNKNRSRKFRELGNKILGYFEIAGFKSIWEKHHRSTNVDGTFNIG